MKRHVQQALSPQERVMTERALIRAGGIVTDADQIKPEERWEGRRRWGRRAVRTAMEDTAMKAERRRQKPYLVICECEGQTIIFGESEYSQGGMALSMVKLVPWAKNPRVVVRRTWEGQP